MRDDKSIYRDWDCTVYLCKKCFRVRRMTSDSYSSLHTGHALLSTDKGIGTPPPSQDSSHYWIYNVAASCEAKLHASLGTLTYRKCQSHWGVPPPTHTHTNITSIAKCEKIPPSPQQPIVWICRHRRMLFIAFPSQNHPTSRQLNIMAIKPPNVITTLKPLLVCIIVSCLVQKRWDWHKIYQLVN